MSVTDLKREREARGLEPNGDSPTENGGGRSISDRAADPVLAADAQDGLFDNEIEDPALLRALKKRQKAIEAAAEPKREEKEAKAAAKALLDAHELEVGTVTRVGPFRIKVTRREPNEVSFTTAPGKRVDISLFE